MEGTCMFHFYRTRTGSTEVFEILILKDSLPDAESRFGKPLGYGHRGQPFHHVGGLVLVHDGPQVEYFVGCRSQFRENELSVFYQELEMLAGHDVHVGGSEAQQGWFEHDHL